MATPEIGLFLSVLRCPDVERACALAHDLGFRVIQCGKLADHVYTADGATMLAAVLRRFQLEATALTLVYDGESYASIDAVRRTVGLVPPETRLSRLAYSRRCIDTASAIGVPLVTAHLGFIPSDTTDPDYGSILAAVDDLALYGRARGVQLGLETGQETAEELLTFIARLTVPVGVNFDGANFVAYGIQDPHIALELLRPHLVGVHVKDYTHPISRELLGRPCPLGEGAARVLDTIALLATSGYSEPIILETYDGADPIQTLTSARNLVTQYWERLSHQDL